MQKIVDFLVCLLLSAFAVIKGEEPCATPLLIGRKKEESSWSHLDSSKACRDINSNFYSLSDQRSWSEGMSSLRSTTSSLTAVHGEHEMLVAVGLELNATVKQFVWEDGIPLSNNTELRLHWTGEGAAFTKQEFCMYIHYNGTSENPGIFRFSSLGCRMKNKLVVATICRNSTGCGNPLSPSIKPPPKIQEKKPGVPPGSTSSYAATSLNSTRTDKTRGKFVEARMQSQDAAILNFSTTVATVKPVATVTEIGVKSFYVYVAVGFGIAIFTVSVLGIAFLYFTEIRVGSTDGLYGQHKEKQTSYKHYERFSRPRR